MSSLSTHSEAKSGSGLARRLSHAWLRFRLALATGRFGRRAFKATRFLYVPPHLHRCDPSIANDMMSGQITLAGRALLTGGKSPFDLPAPSEGFTRALNGFHWLADFDASERRSVREYARVLAQDFMKRRENAPSSRIEDPEVTARRVISWLTHCGLLTESVGLEAYQQVLDHLARDAAILRLLITRAELGVARLDVAIALLFHALCLDTRPKARQRAESLLNAALQAIMYPDGGIRTRNPARIATYAADLISILSLYRARQAAPPQFIGVQVQRMVAFLRMMQHPDGGLALFHGGGLASRDLIAEVTRFNAGMVARQESAPETGFERLEDQYGILIVDTGNAPPRAFGEEAGASALAFEFSTRSDRIIVNCGIPLSAEGESERIYRSAIAHSTFTLDDAQCGRFVPALALDGRDILRLKSKADWFFAPLRKKNERGESLTIGHSAFKAEAGYVVERQLTLLAHGGGLSGLDRLVDAANTGGTHRAIFTFHLYPGLIATPLSSGEAIVLRLPHRPPGDDLWVFEAPGHRLELEESRCFEQEGANARTSQIVLDLTFSGGLDLVWRLVPYHPDFLPASQA